MIRALCRFGPDRAFSRLMTHDSRLSAQAVDPRIQAIVDSVSAERLAATVRARGFGTRYPVGHRIDDQGNRAARRWIFEQFRAASPRLRSASTNTWFRRRGG